MGQQTNRPNILFILTDQQRYDTIAALGNADIYTPNLDRLVGRGASMLRAYSPSPVCVPARYVIRTGCEPITTSSFQNERPAPIEGVSSSMTERCGDYLAAAMGRRGYRSFGIGKFHTIPVEEDIGYDVYQRCEEMDGYMDSYAQSIWSHPAYRHVEQLHGERTEMYYQPQVSPLPLELTSEYWCADRAIEQIKKNDPRPYFGVVSFVGPHPPFAPPVPFNRMYDPDRMRNPVCGPESVDLMDPRVPWNRYFVFAEDVSNAQFRTLRARYYGEISYIDYCIGRMLDAVEASGRDEDTLIVFTSDHGEFLGDHRAVQKENFFEESAHISMLISWPRRIATGKRYSELVTLTDLFGLATSAAGSPELRDGIELLGLLSGERIDKRTHCFGYTSAPGTLHFRMMAIRDMWKYVFHANGGGELLFDLSTDHAEHVNLIDDRRDISAELREQCVRKLDCPAGRAALEIGDKSGSCGGALELKVFPRTVLPLERVYQMNRFRGVTGFPDRPHDVVYRPFSTGFSIRAE
jgi:arylsulfatase